MRAFRTQFVIAFALCLLGVVTWVIDYRQDLGGDWFPRFGFTRMVWMGIGIYILASSNLVLLAGLLCRLRGWPYTGAGVLLTHGIGIGMVLAALSLGIHDRIDDAWQAGQRPGDGDTTPSQPPRRPILASPPLSPSAKRLPQAPGTASSEITPEKLLDTAE